MSVLEKAKSVKEKQLHDERLRLALDKEKRASDERRISGLQRLLDNALQEFDGVNGIKKDGRKLLKGSDVIITAEVRQSKTDSDWVIAWVDGDACLEWLEEGVHFTRANNFEDQFAETMAKYI